MNSVKPLETLYRGSVKDVLGPVVSGGAPCVVFEYTDAYSVFDWGRMPDPLPGKGAALALMAAWCFEKLEDPKTWKEFSAKPEALALRKGAAKAGSTFSSTFNDLGEKLQAEGMRTHFVGLLESLSQPQAKRVGELSGAVAPRHLCVRQVSVVKPRPVTVLGKPLYDYRETLRAQAPRLVSLEVVFRFGIPQGSSMLERLEELGIQADHQWDLPHIDFYSKLEASDRLLSISEALALSGLSGEKFQEVIQRTAWVAGWLKAEFARLGLELADGKLEWAIDARGECMLVDAIGPDELRILKGTQGGQGVTKNGIQLSKEFLRGFYRDTPWHRQLSQLKSSGPDWKSRMSLKPEPLSAEYREAATQLYPVLVNELTARRWFSDAWPLAELLNKLSAIGGGR